MKVPAILPLAILTTCSLSYAQQQIEIGRTWPIAEPDPIVLAKKRAQNLTKDRLTPVHSYRTTLAATNISRVQTPKTRYFMPWHETQYNIYDKDGEVLYPAGYRYNYLFDWWGYKPRYRYYQY